MAIKDARCNTPPCPHCVEKDAEIERISKSVAALTDTLAARYGEDDSLVRILRSLLRGEG